MLASSQHNKDALQAGTPARELIVDETFSVEEIASQAEPVILRGLVKDWPVTQAAKRSREDLLAYLLKYDAGAVVPVSAGPATLDGRLFYSDDFSGMNVERGNAKFAEVLHRVYQHGAGDPPPLIYLASTDIDECLPGFRADNDLAFGEASPLASIWIGTSTRVAAHNDLPLNIACVVAGKRRFTLFPPDQIANLYVGPFELTPAGRPISFVDFAKPDLERYPRFADAMASAQIADMGPGDALFLPSMWWHHVEAKGAFNILVNYWWRTTPSYLGTPQDVLTHAMLTIRDLPPDQKKILSDMFDYYVFENAPEHHSHIPEHARGSLAPMSRDNARRVRAMLLNRLNR